MDIYSFVNSKAIREHLRKIEYQFNSMETAWLIRHCKKLSYKRRKEFWQELLDTMPDCEVPKRGIFDGWNSLHEMIKVYIGVVDRNVKKFYQDKEPGKYVYTYVFLHSDDSDWTKEYETVYGSLEECVKEYKENWFEGIIRYRIRKQSLEDVKKVIEMEFRENGELEDLWQGEIVNESEKKALTNNFEGFWFNFPTPFKKGDLLWIPNLNRSDETGGEECFVLDELSTWNPPEHIRNHGDDTDMCGHCYCLAPDNTIFYDSICNYMDFEFYNGPYSLEKKILVALSKFLKGEITVDILLNAYQWVKQKIEVENSFLDSWQLERLKEMEIE